MARWRAPLAAVAELLGATPRSPPWADAAALGGATLIYFAAVALALAQNIPRSPFLLLPPLGIGCALAVAWAVRLHFALRTDGGPGVLALLAAVAVVHAGASLMLLHAMLLLGTMLAGQIRDPVEFKMERMLHADEFIYAWALSPVGTALSVVGVCLPYLVIAGAFVANRAWGVYGSAPSVVGALALGSLATLLLYALRPAAHPAVADVVIPAVLTTGVPFVAVVIALV